MSIMVLIMPPGGQRCSATPFTGQGRTKLYIAMNRFRIGAGFEDGFEEMWRTRDSKLDGVPGFQEFKMLRGPELEGGGTLFISHSVWESYDSFKDWTESDAFKAAHGKSRAPEGTYLGHPQFEGFEVVTA